MTTRVVASDAVAKAKPSSTIDHNGTTTIRSESIRPLHYLVCDDPKNHSPFMNPRAAAKQNKSSETTNGDEKELRGTRTKAWSWPCRSTTPSWILESIALFDTLFISWWIMHALNVYHEKIPLSAKRKVTFVAWEWYVWIHTLVVCQWMGFYADQSFYNEANTIAVAGDSDDDATISDEFKALSTLLYPTQFYPVDVPRIRFSLSELNGISLRDIPSEDSFERIHEEDSNNGFVVPESQRDHQTVSGLYVTNQNKNKTASSCGGPKKILFWIYGGAYLGGDAEANLSIANEFLVDCDADAVFIPSYRLAPEASVDDVLWDICWSYRYLLGRLETTGIEQLPQNDNDERFEIVMVGISSGGAVALRLLQFLRDRSAGLPLMPTFLEPVVDDVRAISTRSSTKVAGAVLFAPYVDYRDPQPQNGSFLRNAKYDWIVTESVQHYGLPYLDGFIPPVGDDLTSTVGTNMNGRIQYSPLSYDMNDLPPICLITSEHEACYDMSIEIVNKARGKAAATTGGRPTDITIGLWKHMCHVFSVMQAFLPEGKASVEFAKDWIRTNTANNNTNNTNSQ